MKRYNFESLAAIFLLFIGLLCGLISYFTISFPAITVLFAGLFAALVIGALCLITERS